MSKFTGETLTQAKTYVQERSKEGVECPCCNQLVKVYGRSIHSSMAVVLVMLHKYFAARSSLDWLHVSDFPVYDRFNINGDYSYLKHWGLLLPHPEQVGYWLVTERGHQFARGEISVKKTVFLLNNHKVGESDHSVNITQALGKRFKYDEIVVPDPTPGEVHV